MKKNSIIGYLFPVSLFTIISSLMIARTAQAICPLCTVAVAGGLGLSRWLGIDDAVSGIWIGGLTMSISLWTIDWCERKKYDFYARDIIIILSYYFLVFISFYWIDALHNEANKLWGVDKIILGVLLGSAVFPFGNWINLALKKKNNDKAYFPFQKVVMPLGALALISLVFYFITK